MSEHQLLSELAECRDLVQQLRGLLLERPRLTAPTLPAEPPLSILNVKHTGVVVPLPRFLTGTGEWRIGRPCLACRQPFRPDEATTLLALGPGADREQRELARAGQPFAAVVVHLHYACVTGSEAGVISG